MWSSVSLSTAAAGVWTWRHSTSTGRHPGLVPTRATLDSLPSCPTPGQSSGWGLNHVLWPHLNYLPRGPVCSLELKGECSENSTPGRLTVRVGIFLSSRMYLSVVSRKGEMRHASTARGQRHHCVHCPAWLGGSWQQRQGSLACCQPTLAISLPLQRCPEPASLATEVLGWLL